MNRIAEDLVFLVSCAVNGTVPDVLRIREIDLDAVYTLAARHKLTATVAFALESAGFKDERSCNAIALSLRKSLMFDNEWNMICSKLNDAGIWYMPLKGAVLKGMYPRCGMREFADFDILFDPARADDVRTIMEAMGYESKGFGTSNHDVYYKKPVFNFEMHRTLFGPSHDESLFNYFKDVENRLVGKSAYERCFTPEDFYLYMLSHEFKHYDGSGTGLRSLLDVYVYLGKTGMDMNYVSREAEKLGLREFEILNRSLSLHLFSGDVLSDEERETLDYFISSGSYGTIKHRIENTMTKNGWGKIRYSLGRFSVPVSRKNSRYEAYAKMYPFFYKHRVFLPVLPFYRTFRSMKSGRFRKEARAIMDARK